MLKIETSLTLLRVRLNLQLGLGDPKDESRWLVYDIQILEISDE